MKRKKIAALLLGTALGVSMVTGCGSQAGKSTAASSGTEQTASSVSAESTSTSSDSETESADPLEAITEGYYTYGYPVGDMQMSYFFHFYPEQPVLGKVFYAGMCMNQINFAGTYDVVEEPYDYSCYASRADQEADKKTDGTAPYTIHFYDWSGNELDKCGYDGENMYSNMTAIVGTGGDNVILRHDTEGENSEYASTYEAEAGQVYASYVSEADASSTIALYHNGRYQDMVDMMIEGTWGMEKTDTGYSFKLTPDSDSDTAAVLEVTEDFAKATYTPDGGEAVELINNKNAGPAVSFTLTGKIAIPGQDSEADIVGNLYDDGTVTLSASAFGSDFELDKGTYSVDESYVYTFQFDNAGELTSGFGESGAELTYVQSGNEVFGDINEVLTIGLPE